MFSHKIFYDFCIIVTFLLLFNLLVFNCNNDNPTLSEKGLLPPSNLQAKVISARQVELTWQDNSESESGFELERRIGKDGVIDKIQKVGKNSTRFRDTGLLSGTPYSYRIRAIAGIQESDYSNMVSVITRANEGPWKELANQVKEHLYGVSMREVQLITVVGERGLIMQSDDAGKSWAKQMSGTSDIFMDVNFLTPDLGYVVGTNLSGNASLIFKTLDGGNAWINISPAFLRKLRAVNFLNSEIGIIVGDQGIILRTSDGGINWQRISPEASADLNGVQFVNSNLVMAVGAGGLIMQSLNGSRDWQVIMSPTN